MHVRQTPCHNLRLAVRPVCNLYSSTHDIAPSPMESGYSTYATHPRPSLSIQAQLLDQQPIHHKCPPIYHADVLPEQFDQSIAKYSDVSHQLQQTTVDDHGQSPEYIESSHWFQY